MKRTTSAENKTLVIEAFDTLFNKRDYAAAERYWSPNYIQHSAHIEPGRAGLFNLIKGTPPTLKYEPGLIVADGEFVIVHGRFSNHGGPKNWIAADIVRIVDGLLVEHWDVLQDEASRTESKSGLPCSAPTSASERRRHLRNPNNETTADQSRAGKHQSSARMAGVMAPDFALNPAHAPPGRGRLPEQA